MTDKKLDTALNREDRDMIIGLNVKVDRLILDIKEIKDDNSIRIAKLEARADGIDQYHAAIDRKHLFEVLRWVDDYRANLRLFVVVGGAIILIAQALLITFIRKIFGI